MPEIPTPKLARQLQRYHQRCRPAVMALAGKHPRLADLALSHPGLLFTLAMRPGTPGARTAANQIVAGASLKEASATVGLPMWLRTLPPEAFTSPLPTLPDGDLFRRQIGNHLPQKPHLASRWLAAVADAGTWAGEPIALWLAREMNRKAQSGRSLRTVYLWAWHCNAPGTPGHALLKSSWKPCMSYATALAEARDWLDRVELRLELGSGPIRDLWAEPGHVAGYDFLPIATIADIEAEAEAMRNCISTYGSAISDDCSQLWSVRQNGERVATLELSILGDDWFPVVYELKHAGNERCSAEIWWAARRWLNAQHLPYVISRYEAPIDRARWHAMWKPYWLSLGHVPRWLPLQPSRGALGRLCRIGPTELAGLRQPERRQRRRRLP